MNGTPQPKAYELFNRLAELTIEDVGTAQKFAAEAAILNRQLRGDFTTKVVLAEALLLSGQRSDAVDQVVGAYSVRDRSQYAVMDRLALLLAFVAEREKALEVIEEIAFQPGVFEIGSEGSNHAQIAAWAVDIDLIRRLAERDQRANVEGGAAYFAHILSEFEHLDELAVHQKTLIEAVRDVQVAVCFLPAFDASGSRTLINNILFDGTAISRRQLESRVASALEYQVRDKLDGSVINVFTAAPTPVRSPLKVIAGGVPASA